MRLISLLVPLLATSPQGCQGRGRGDGVRKGGGGKARIEATKVGFYFSFIYLWDLGRDKQDEAVASPGDMDDCSNDG